MREYERYELAAKVNVRFRDAARRAVKRTPRPPKVNRAAVVLGDPLVVLGGFLRVFSRRR